VLLPAGLLQTTLLLAAGCLLLLRLLWLLQLVFLV
jgi:hypothetical protein